MRKVRLTDHARERAAEMGVGTKEVKRTVREPELEYTSNKWPTAMVSVRDRLAIPHVDDRQTRIVLTVLWRGREGREETT